MRGPNFANWLDRPALLVGGVFVVGAAIAGVVVAIIMLRGDGGGESVKANDTPAPTVTQVPATPTALRFSNPGDAVAAYVNGQLGQTYVGPCPTSAAGVCSTELYRSDILATYFVGPSQSEGVGEIVLQNNGDGTWNLVFVTAAPPISELAVGATAVVYGAGDCLNFRPQPGTAGAASSCQVDGTQARVAEGPTQIDSVNWWNLQGYGWASGQFLQPLQQ